MVGQLNKFQIQLGSHYQVIRCIRDRGDAFSSQPARRVNFYLRYETRLAITVAVGRLKGRIELDLDRGNDDVQIAMNSCVRDAICVLKMVRIYFERQFCCELVLRIE